ncbi:MAG: hypothetical protein LBU74_04080 [Methanobacteriaceae archaeon]|jgi:hypothetical protein|nr:hypothetical protein [Candidatus Methanorudis spinitermitis]
MTILKFNLKNKKILLALITIAILAMTISSVSAAITVQFNPNTPSQVYIDSSASSTTYTTQIIINVYDSGSPAQNVDVEIFMNGGSLGVQNTKNTGIVYINPLVLGPCTNTYKAVAGGISATHTITYIDTYSPGGNNPGGSNPGGNNPGGSNPGGNNPGGNNPGGSNPGGSNPGNGAGNSNTLSLEKGVIYKGKNPVGIWDGKDAYVLSSGKLVKSPSYTSQVKQGIAKGQIKSSQIGTTSTSKIIKFVNNIASNKVTSSAVNALSKVYTKVNKGTIASKLIAAEIAANNLGASKFRGNNIILSTNAIKTVLNKDVSTKYIARKNVKVNTLNSALTKGKAILRIKNLKDSKWRYITVSKVSSKKVTVYDNKKSQKVAISSLTSYMKKRYTFSGVAITYNVKIGKTPSTANLKTATGY